MAIVTVSILGFLLIVTFFSERSYLQLNGEEMLSKATMTDYVIQGDYLLKGERFGPSSEYTLIDIRDSYAFEIEHRADAINIPMADLLDKQNRALFASGEPKIIMGHDAMKAHEAWMLLTQLGYEEVYVLEL